MSILLGKLLTGTQFKCILRTKHEDTMPELNDDKYKLHDEPVVVHHPAGNIAKRIQSEPAIHILVDLEGTVIESLRNPRLLIYNCVNISEFIKTRIAVMRKPVVVDIFTWGWKTKDEVNGELVEQVYNSIGVYSEHRGSVFVKEDSVDVWLDRTHDVQDKDAMKRILMQPGGMGKFMVRKASCAIDLLGDNDEAILIDDTVIDGVDTAPGRYGRKVTCVNPNTLLVKVHNELGMFQSELMLCSPDGKYVGCVKNRAAYDDVLSQIRKKHLEGFYFMLNTGRVYISADGDIVDPTPEFKIIIKED